MLGRPLSCVRSTTAGDFFCRVEKMRTHRVTMARLHEQAAQDKRELADKSRQIENLKRQIRKLKESRDTWKQAARHCGAKLSAVKEQGK